MNTELEAAIAKMAYHIWDTEGRPEGLADVHWQRAEFKLMGREGANRGERKSAQPMGAPG